MFENPITIALLVSSVISLAFYLFNREKDKKSRDGYQSRRRGNTNKLNRRLKIIKQ